MRNSLKSTPLIAGVGDLRSKLLRECDRFFHERDLPLELDQVSTLRLLFSSPGLSQAEIGARLQRDKGSVNRTVTVFCDKGIAEIAMNSQDLRKTKITLTTKGKKLAKQVEAVLVQYEQHLASFLSEEEYQTFNILVNRLLTEKVIFSTTTP